jgi:uncharacterized membrane-anchored protein
MGYDPSKMVPQETQRAGREKSMEAVRNVTENLKNESLDENEKAVLIKEKVEEIIEEARENVESATEKKKGKNSFKVKISI